MRERIRILNIQEERPIMNSQGDPFIPIHLSVNHSGGLYPGEELVPASDFDRLLQAAQKWRRVYELSESMKELWQADRDLIQAIEEVGGE